MKQLIFKKTRPGHCEVYWGKWNDNVMIGIAETKAEHRLLAFRSTTQQPDQWRL